jgi:hypothetical protein
MMKYALCNPGEFTHPFTVFCLGLLQLAAVWLTETANLYKSLVLDVLPYVRTAI